MLQPAEVSELELGERDVRVALRAAGVNPVDDKLRGHGRIAGQVPAVLGWDGAGVVEQVGTEVARFQAGEEVDFCDGGFGTTREPTPRPRSWTSGWSLTGRGGRRWPRPRRRRW